MTKLETNKQILLNTVVREVTQQGQPSLFAHSGRCSYRGPHGLKCAIGHLIPDALYNPEFDCSDVDALVAFDTNFRDWKPLVPFLTKLQLAHDLFSKAERDVWRDRFQKAMTYLAKTEGLECGPFEWNEPKTDNLNMC